MMNDTVREELQTKITSGNLPKLNVAPQKQVSPPQPPRPAMINPPLQAPKKRVTADLAAPKTSPTLVEFQNKNASLPDWRLQLQNAVQQRRGGNSTSGQESERAFPTNGGAALKAEVVQPASAAATVVENVSDPRVAAALRRIDHSRKTFAEPSIKRPSPPMVSPRSFPFDVVQKGDSPTSLPRPATHLRTPAPAKPKLVVPGPAREVKRDTNKLPPLPARIERVEPIPSPIEERPIALPTSSELPSEFAGIKRIQIKAEEHELDAALPDIYEDEIEDLAPFSMRFGAGLFDIIVGAFFSIVVLAPFALNGTDWFTASGLLITITVWAVVMFAYMTASLGFLGKTIGMRLFSLELVDAVENEYPTLLQAAVSSSLFLVSLAVFGAGFVTVFFNEERRAVHDLLSGTILVREF
jgi:uncharacterized RDD family membrane protein YckC